MKNFVPCYPIEIEEKCVFLPMQTELYLLIPSRSARNIDPQLYEPAAMLRPCAFNHCSAASVPGFRADIQVHQLLPKISYDYSDDVFVSGFCMWLAENYISHNAVELGEQLDWMRGGWGACGGRREV